MDKYKILIVDDEPDNLALLYRTLRGQYDIEKSKQRINCRNKIIHIYVIL